MARLPPEVADLVIDNLRGDLATLRTCGLVSHNWLATSRYHLYDAVYLPHRNIDTFLDLLQSPCNTFAFRLRGLYVAAFQYAPDLPPRGVDSPHLPFLDFFALYSAQFYSYDKLTAFLLQFPSVKTLKLVHVTCGAEPGPSQKAMLPFHFNALEFTLNPGIMGWLKSLDFSLGAPCLIVDFAQLESGFGDYLKSQGKVLCQLTLKFRAESQLSIFSEQPVLQSLAGLRSLTITHCFTISGEDHIRVAPALVRLLRQLACSQLEQLVFIAALAPGIELASGSPSDAAELLEGVEFASLTRIEFYGPWDSRDDILGRQFKSAISALLPVQAARGVVHVGAHRYE
ncbi:hypothetical protein B0H17DRAFT_1099046 [Mycena rosella]|uniref:F-box domain-containing protein n=1 Tax=Mycena rosella TaxID=1033263 RepID=A0AAD7CNU5_MYCRO|nr:hypothetical protein B0H17DRAFT_1099046 [Mycena rosella]